MSSPSKSLNITVINSFLQKLSTWVTAKSNISTRIDFLLLTSVTIFRAITMFSTDCAYDNSTIIFIGDVFCPNAKCLRKLCLHKKTFQSLGRSDYQCSQCGSVCQVRNFHFEEQINSFFLSLRQGVYVFEERPKSVQEVIGDVYCPSKYCLNTQKCKSIGGYVTTPRSIYGSDICGAWLFVHKVPFTLQEHVKTTKIYKIRFFFAKKDVTRQTIFTQCPVSINERIERKNCVWTLKYGRLSEMCIVQQVETKSVFTFQPIKRLVSTTVKSAKPVASF